MHPTPWELELHALGEDVPNVRTHLPCATCGAALLLLTADPGPPPPSLQPVPPAGPSFAITPFVVAGVAVLAVGVVVAGVLWTPEPQPIAPPVEDPVLPDAATPAPTTPTPARRDPVLPKIAVAPEPSIVLPLTAQLMNQRQVEVPAEGHAFNPLWSPDGTQLAFELNNYGDRSDLYLQAHQGRPMKVNLPGSGPFGGSQVLVNPTWHPDNIVVFEGSNAGGMFRLWFAGLGSGGATEMLPHIPGDLTFPTFTTDGSQLAFVSDATGSGDLRVRDTASTEIRTVSETETPELFPRFSSDGTRLVFSRKTPRLQDVFEIADGVERLVVGGPGDQTRPVYAADTIVYFHLEASKVDLMAVGRSTPLAENVRLPLRAAPALSPDRRWVAFSYEDPARSQSLFLVRTDGSETRELETGFTAVGEPSLTTQANQLTVAYTALPESGADYRTLVIAQIQ